jgi:hypothetical protein
VTLDDDVFEAASTQAKASGQRLGTVLSQLARRGLRAPRIIRNSKGMPVFDVPANSPIIPSTRAKEIMNEEPW